MCPFDKTLYYAEYFCALGSLYKIIYVNILAPYYLGLPTVALMAVPFMHI